MLLVAPPSWRPALACWSAGLEGERSPWRSVGRLEGGATSDPRSLVEPC
ncbi:MAG TPA: hypothetical protein VH599_21295 [Ktedonobacterales bacterium]